MTRILSIRLSVEHDTVGALNLYSRRADAFGATSRREAHLERKAASRDLIGRAKGIVMSPRHVTDDEAFALLREASSRLNIKMTNVAQQVNDTGELPHGGPST